MRKITTGVGKDEVTYLFLIRDTEKGAMLSAAQRRKEFNAVNSLVKEEGGQCRLYSTRGASCDFASVISGVSPAGAIRIAAEIEKQGSVKATLISGLEIFQTP
jgi:uncharacterized protein with GYD domain